ncbi:MAG: GTP-binding protein [Paenisporosarcina sp.]
MYKTIGILAHVDAGKTTFSEQLLYHTKSIKQRGRVDHKDAFLDSHEIEKNRGITVFADQAVFQFNESTFYLIDTPGHVDFSPEMERAIQVMDVAILIISAVDGVQGHTETIWQLLRKHQVPTFFFLNKTDQEGADVERVLENIRTSLTKSVFDCTSSLTKDTMTEPLIEFLAEQDDALFEAFMESGYDKDLWLQTMKNMVQQNSFFPCATGSALKDVGVIECMELVDLLTDTRYVSEWPFAAQVYKIRYDESETRLTFLKCLSGTLRVRDEVSYGPDDNRIIEKVTQIRKVNGQTFESVQQVSAGELFAITGLTQPSVGDGIGENKEKSHYEMVPTLTSKVIFDASVHVKDMLRCFHQLDAEDPSLRVIWNEQSKEIHVHVMGVIQLEVLEQMIKDRFHYKISFGDPQILYKETIEAPVNGYGHFEPLKHYAEVHLQIEPAERNSGLTFENVCHANDLSIGHQNLVLHHLSERNHHGLLTGSTLTDVKITLLTGRGHNEHTSGGDFREASYRALRQGLEKAQNLLLEPYYDFTIKVELEHIGKVFSDIQQAKGTFDPPETIGNQTVVKGRVPVATFMNYSIEFASFTHGKGTLHMLFSGYDRCHNPEEVIEKFGYNKNADPEYSSTSIFCAKGKGYPVPWDEAESMMHCL